uniref:Uncharacterized protein n=1 Tax=Heterorhabditis bacteriophora TaxID=37862 RepID=A0A1I7WJF1_HETBA
MSPKAIKKASIGLSLDWRGGGKHFKMLKRCGARKGYLESLEVCASENIVRSLGPKSNRISSLTCISCSEMYISRHHRFITPTPQVFMFLYTFVRTPNPLNGHNVKSACQTK